MKRAAPDHLGPIVTHRTDPAVVAEEARAKWIKVREVTEIKHGTWHRLIGMTPWWERSDTDWGNPYNDGPDFPDRLPADDHCSLWRRKDGGLIWVSQPYPLGREGIAEMLAAAEQFQLQFVINVWPAWHFPGHVLFIEWTVRK